MSTVVQGYMKCTCCEKKFGIGVIGSTSGENARGKRRYKG